MNKSKLTLLVDGNWLLMSRLAVLNNKYSSDEEMVKELNLLMIKSMNIVLRTFPNIDNIIFISDGGSWRNDVTIPDVLRKKGVEYKGNREKSDDIDWDLIFGGYEKFIEYLKACGVTVSKCPGIEGDDWCWYWSTKLNADNTNVIIWSRDKDLTQLVTRNSNGCFTVCYNKENGLTVIDKQEEEMDFFFNMIYSENDVVYNAVVSKSPKVLKINPKSVVIDKIIRGDAGDNILPIIVKKSKNADSGRVFRVASKDIDPNLDINSDIEVKRYINAILNSKAYVGKVEDTAEQIYEHFKYNRTLVYLDGTVYPDDVIRHMEETCPTYECSTNINSVNEMIQAEKNDVDLLLETI